MSSLQELEQLQRELDTAFPHSRFEKVRSAKKRQSKREKRKIEDEKQKKLLEEQKKQQEQIKMFSTSLFGRSTMASPTTAMDQSAMRMAGDDSYNYHLSSSHNNNHHNSSSNNDSLQQQQQQNSSLRVDTSIFAMNASTRLKFAQTEMEKSSAGKQFGKSLKRTMSSSTRNFDQSRRQVSPMNSNNNNNNNQRRRRRSSSTVELDPAYFVMSTAERPSIVISSPADASSSVPRPSPNFSNSFMTKSMKRSPSPLSGGGNNNMMMKRRGSVLEQQKSVLGNPLDVLSSSDKAVSPLSSSPSLHKRNQVLNSDDPSSYYETAVTFDADSCDGLLKDIFATIHKKRDEIKHVFKLSAEHLDEEQFERREVEMFEKEARKNLVNRIQHLIEGLKTKEKLLNVNADLPVHIKNRLADRNHVQRKQEIDHKKNYNENMKNGKLKLSNDFAAAARKKKEAELEKQEIELIEKTEKIQMRRQERAQRTERVKHAMQTVKKTRARAVAIETVINSMEIEVQKEQQRNRRRDEYQRKRDELLGVDSTNGTNAAQTPVFSPSAFLQSLYHVNDEDTMSEAKKRKFFEKQAKIINQQQQQSRLHSAPSSSVATTERSATRISLTPLSEQDVDRNLFFSAQKSTTRPASSSTVHSTSKHSTSREMNNNNKNSPSGSSRPPMMMRVPSKLKLRPMSADVGSGGEEQHEEQNDVEEFDNDGKRDVEEEGAAGKNEETVDW